MLSSFTQSPTALQPSIGTSYYFVDWVLFSSKGLQSAEPNADSPNSSSSTLTPRVSSPSSSGIHEQGPVCYSSLYLPCLGQSLAHHSLMVVLSKCRISLSACFKCFIVKSLKKKTSNSIWLQHRHIKEVIVAKAKNTGCP